MNFHTIIINFCTKLLLCCWSIFFGFTPLVVAENVANHIGGSIDSENLPQSQLITLDKRSSIIERPELLLDWHTCDATLVTKNQSCTSYCRGYYLEPNYWDLSSIPGEQDSLRGIANEIQYIRQQKVKLQGQVVLQQNKQQVECKTALIDLSLNNIDIEGPMRLQETGLLILGDYAKINQQQQTATVYNAQYVLREQMARGIAKELIVELPDHLISKNSLYTSCPPGNQDWQIKGRKIVLDRKEGWGEVFHTTFYVQKLPVMYLPYFRFPLDNRRQTGFLYPEINSLSQVDIAIPFYFNIASQQDATIIPRRIGGRGTLLEGQYRYLMPWGLQKLEAAYLEKDETYDGQERSRFLWHSRLNWLHAWAMNTDFQYVSDEQYPDDFNFDLSEQSRSFLPRTFSIEYEEPQQFFQVRLDSFQIIDNELEQQNQPYRKLPEVNWQIDRKIHAAIWRNYWQYIYFDHSNESTMPSVQRLHWDTQIDWPKIWSWGYINSTVRLQHTQFEQKDEDTSQRRTLASFSMDAGIAFDRHTRHLTRDRTYTIEPRVFYNYVPFRDQTDLPLIDATELVLGWEQLFRKNRFSGLDRIGDSNQMTVAVTSRVWENTNSKSPVSHQTSNERMRTSLGQIFYFSDRKTQLEDITPETTNSSALFVENIIRWSATTNSKWEIIWDYEQNILEQGLYQMYWQPLPKTWANFGYRYLKATDESSIDQGEITFSHQLKQNWKVFGRWHFDFIDQATLEHFSGLIYESCCWKSAFMYYRRVSNSLEDTDDTIQNKYSFKLQLELKGLGIVGNKIEQLLQRRRNDMAAF